ncbi:DUF4376 domain-containing protein [Paraburkholderia youngii]|uniref:DUF4376 domain-containing protein n=1 Tax=Paraburkholderia youngii TaxID=2782701 RepID=UPI003D2202E7
MNFYQLPSGEVAGFDDPNIAPEGATEITADQFAQIVATPVLTADQKRARQKALIDTSYAVAVQEPVSFKTAGGVTNLFDGDATSQTILMQTTQGYTIAGGVPSGFYWVAVDNSQVPFTLADLQGLYTTMLARGWTAFQKRQTLKAQVDAADVNAVQGIVW